MKQELLGFLPEHHPWRDRIQIHEELSSTNTYAKELARQGAPEGTVVIARSQTGGRGRMGRSFHSPRDTGLYLSLIIRPNCPADRLMHLTCAAALAACDAIAHTCGLHPGIKWINDLTMAEKKLGGILTELGFGTDGSVSYGIIGIGINCRPCSFPEELENLACSLSDFTAAPQIPPLAAALVVALEEMNRTLLPRQAAIMDRYRQCCITIGKQVRVISSDGTETGTALGVNEDGSLTVRFSDGTCKTVNSGEVSVRGLWDYL